MSRNLSTKTAQWVENADPSTLDAQGFREAIDHAFAVGDHMLARRLATQGAALYPDDARLVRMAYLLAPPVVTKRKGDPSRSARTNQLWLVRNFEEYKGQWVALRNGELLGAANSLEELTAKVADRTDAMITIV